MEFAGTMHRGTWEMVADWLAGMIGKGAAAALPDRPAFLLPYEDTMTEVRIDPWDDDEASIVLTCPVAIVEAATPALLGHLVDASGQPRFGMRAFDSERNLVLLRGTLLGSTCDLPELSEMWRALAVGAGALQPLLEKQFAARRVGRDAYREAWDAATQAKGGAS